jgi:hypothetical protein
VTCCIEGPMAAERLSALTRFCDLLQDRGAAGASLLP